MQNLIDQQSPSDHNLSDAVAMSGKGVDASVMRDTQRPPTVEPPQALLLPNQPHSSPPNSNSHATPCTTNSAAGGAAARLGTTTGAASTSSPSTTAHFPLRSNNNADIIAMNRRGPFASGLPSYPASSPPPPPPPPYHSSSPASTTHTTTSASMGFDRGGNSPHLLPVAATTAHHVSATLAGISAAPRVVPCFSDGTLSNSLVTHHSTPTHSWAQSVGAAEEPSTLPHLLSREQLPTPQQLFTSLGSSSNISNNNNNTSTTNVAAASTSPAPYLFSSHTSPATAPTTSASPGPTTSSATTATAARQMLSGSQQHPMGIHSHPSSSSGGSGSTRERQPSGVGGGGSGGGSGHTSWLHPSRPAPSLLSASGPTPPPPPPRTMTVQSSGERQFVFASRSRSHTPHQRVLSGSTDGGSSALGGATGGTSTGGGGGGGGGGLGGGSSSGRGRGCSPCSSSTIASLASPSVIHQRRPTQPQFDDVVSSPSTPASAPASAPPVMQLDASASPSRVEPTSTSTTATTAVAAASEMASLPAPLLRAETDYAESEVSPSPTPTEELPRCSLIATRPPQPPASSASNLMDVLAIDGVVAATTPIPLCFSAAAAPSSPSSPTPTLQRTGTTLPIATTTPTPSAPAAGADAAAPLVEHHVDPIANNPSPDGSIEACLERRKKKRPPSLFAQPAATTPIASPPTAASSSPVATVMSSSSGGATPGGATAAATLTAVGSVLPTTTTILSPLEMSLHDSGGLHLLGMKAAGVPSPLASTTTLTIPSELPSVVPSRSGHLGSWARSTSVEIGRPAAGSLTSPPIWSASPSIAPAARRPTAAPPLPLPPSSISTPHPTHRTRRATVRLSRDRRTLVAGIFRVSPSGCLTVRNVLLLNPKGLASYSDLQRINSMGSQRPGSSVLVSPLLCPPSGMLPSREATATANDFLSSHYAPPPPPPPPGARLLQPHLLCSPTTATELEEANDAEGSAYPIFAAGGGSVAGGQHTNYFGGGGGRSIAHGPPGGNRSFALLSASMDTPYSPITYSMDSPFFPSAGPTQGSLGAAGGASTHSRHGYGGGGGGMSSVVVEDGVLRRGVPGSSHDVDASGGGVAMTPVEMVSSSHYSAPKRPRYPLGSPAGGGSDHPTSSQYTNYNNNNNSIFSTRRGGGTFGSAASCNTFGTQIVAAAASPTTHRAVSEVGLGEAPKSLLAYAEIPERDIRLDSVSNTLQFPANAVRYDDLDVKEAVGEGASASVFVALHHPTGRRLAVKRIDLSPLGLDACSLDGQQATPYFMMRSNTGRVAQLQHNVVRELQVLHLTYRSPFMVKVYNAFYRHERAALDIVMEFMHYGSLDHLAKALQAYAAEHPRSTTGMREVPSASSPTTLIHTAAQRRGSPSSPTATSTTTTNNNNNNFFNHFSHTSTNNHLLHLHSNSSMDHNPSGMAVSPLLSRPTSLRILSGLGSTPVSNGGDGFPNMGLPPYRLSAQNLDPYSNNSNSAMSRAVEEVVEESVGVSERLVAVVGEQLLCGVRDMHTRGYIHRDIKPGNVLINEHGIVKLSDFGLSQRCGAGERPMSMESSTTAAHAMMMAEGLTPKLGAMRYGGIHATDSGSGSGITPPFLGMDEMVPRNLHARRPSIGSTALLNDPLQDGMDVLPTACSSSSSSSRSPTSPSHVDDVVEQSPYSGEASASTTQVVMEDGDAPSCITCTPTPHLTRGQRAAKCRPGPLPMAPSAPLRNNDGVSPPPMMMQPEMDGGGGEEEEDDPLMHCSGTNKYMSPERQRGEVHGKPSDIWAVGVSLAEFALGRYPFDLHDCGDDEFERMARMGVAVDVRAFADPPRRVPFSAEFVDFIRLATLPVAADRLTAQELLEHPFFRQWSTPFDLKRYLAERVPVASNKYKTEFFARREAEEQMMMMRGGGSYNASSSCPMTLPGGLCAGAESTELV